GVLDAQVDEVARFDLRRRTVDRLALVVVFLAFAFQLLGEVLLVEVDDLGTRHVELAVASDVNLGIRQRDVAELLLELVGIVAADGVLAGQLQYLVVLARLAEARLQVSAEQALAGAAAAKINDLLVAARLGPDADRNACVAAADAQVAVLHDDRER